MTRKWPMMHWFRAKEGVREAKKKKFGAIFFDFLLTFLDLYMAEMAKKDPHHCFLGIN